ncbi:alpha-L-rhamnosidase-related protein [Algibacillus agarilyticus]|uniref:alpha-L-rhamnosidase-related protein n=1 Tax=Algibacillus agarilyticus TaxID=2234133 RepID=UPI000DD01D1E|nr:alpha-L-rhamnosidase C-terminal domain-containing protein [Algibacillus agarilyticus]
MPTLLIRSRKSLYLFIVFILVGCQQISTIQPSYFFQPNDLRIELLKGTQVFNINDKAPEFSWAVNAEQNYAAQTAYQIQLWDLTTQQAYQSQPWWDSGQQQSGQSAAVSYQGKPLTPNTTYQWRVKVWLQSSQLQTIESAWSAPQLFKTAKKMNAFASQHPLTTSNVPAKYIKKLKSGNYLIDFGKVGFGYLALTLTSTAAGNINVILSERGDDQGALQVTNNKSSVRYYQVPLAVNAKQDVYAVHPPRDKRNTKANKAIAIPAQFGRISPFRYVEIDPGELSISNIQATQVMLHYPFNEHASYFNSSDQTLNAIWDLSKYSMKATSFAGIYVDGDRERIPYEADAYINQLSHYLVDDEYSLARYSHEYLMDHQTWPTEWKQHSIMMAWTDWQYTGDLESLKQFYKQLKTDKAFLNLANDDGLLESFPIQKRAKNRDIVDWPPNERDGFEFKKINTVVNAFHYLNLNQMVQIAKALGYQHDAAIYQKRAKRLYQAFNQQLFDQQTGLYRDGVGSNHSSAHANILPLAVGLVPDKRKANVITFIKAKKMAVSVYFAQYLLEALYLTNESAHALSLLTSKGIRSWFNMIRVGSTITLEAWDDKFKPNQDWNHAWGAVPGNIVGRFILGVRPLAPGFSTFSIAPQLADLTLAEGKVPSIKGPINIKAEQVLGQSVTLHFTVPNNSNAIVSLPFAEGKHIKSVVINNSPVDFDALTGRLINDDFPPGEYKLKLVYNASSTQ